MSRRAIWTKSGEDTLNLLSSCAARFGQTLIIVTHDLEIAKKRTE